MKADQIALGTANFGLPYGIKNGRKLPTAEVEKILRTCRTSGVTTLDTAVGYGESQQVLGEVGCCDFDCITKLPGLPTQLDDVLGWMRSQVAHALVDLRQDRLYGLLLHRPSELLGPRGPELSGALRQVQKEFDIEKVGISVYEPQELLECWKLLKYDLVQVPCNVFDQRFADDTTLAHLKLHSIEVHARSVFLQGLLLMETSSRPAYFNPWTQVFEAWQELVYSSERSPLELCLAFASEQGFVNKWVIGVDSNRQLLQILNAGESVERSVPSDSWSKFKGLPLELISPARWGLQ
jgi:aryl-alcohol dehydrogenase-like predicted oxidoreductase